MTLTEVIIAEYATPSAVTPEAAAQQLASLKRCLAVREATLLRSYTSLDGTRLLRLFSAPDAGAVRYAHASAGITNVAIWSATERDTL
jgi:hypothetical protein